jgi:hypothetical protein
MTDRSPGQVASELGITEVLHFTTEKGVLGCLRKGALLSRKRVQDDPDLAFIFTGVWPRRDLEWIDHVSLSLTRINRGLYAKAANNLPELWWGILSFDPSLLDDPGVVFTTTNNVYNEVCERAEGVGGLEAMFKDEVPWGYLGSVKRRGSGTPENLPTDTQAEVLYPGELPLSLLRAIYVRREEHRRLVLAWSDVLGQDEPYVVVRPDLFA